MTRFAQQNYDLEPGTANDAGVDDLCRSKIQSNFHYIIGEVDTTASSICALLLPTHSNNIKEKHVFLRWIWWFRLTENSRMSIFSGIYSPRTKFFRISSEFLNFFIVLSPDFKSTDQGFSRKIRRNFKVLAGNSSIFRSSSGHSNAQSLHFPSAWW